MNNLILINERIRRLAELDEIVNRLPVREQKEIKNAVMVMEKNMQPLLEVYLFRFDVWPREGEQTCFSIIFHAINNNVAILEKPQVVGMINTMLATLYFEKMKLICHATKFGNARKIPEDTFRKVCLTPGLFGLEKILPRAQLAKNISLSILKEINESPLLFRNSIIPIEFLDEKINQSLVQIFKEAGYNKKINSKEKFTEQLIDLFEQNIEALFDYDVLFKTFNLFTTAHKKLTDLSLSGASRDSVLFKGFPRSNNNFLGLGSSEYKIVIDGENSAVMNLMNCFGLPKCSDSTIEPIKLLPEQSRSVVIKEKNDGGFPRTITTIFNLHPAMPGADIDENLSCAGAVILVADSDEAIKLLLKKYSERKPNESLKIFIHFVSDKKLDMSKVPDFVHLTNWKQSDSPKGCLLPMKDLILPIWKIEKAQLDERIKKEEQVSNSSLGMNLS